MAIYTLGSHKQLIDINEDLVNFEAEIQVVSKEGAPFEAIIVTQTQLDSGEPVNYKLVREGIFQANIKQDNGMYDNYLLLLKSDTGATVEANIAAKAVQQARAQPPLDTRQSDEILASRPTAAAKESWLQRYWKHLAVIAIILIGGIVLWFLYMRKAPDPVLDGNIYDNSLAAVKPPPLPVETLEVEVPRGGVDPGLLSRLNSILAK